MPLNPNGKIDKRALPFPVTAEAGSAPRVRASRATPKLSSTEAAISAIWGDLLPSPPVVIPIDERFFDLGGHSILATRLVFELRKKFVVEAPLGLVFEQPTIKELAKDIDTLRDPHFGLARDLAAKVSRAAGIANGAMTSVISPEYYSADLGKLAPKYSLAQWTRPDGFLGAYILRESLIRPNHVAQVICLVRARSAGEVMDRLRENSTDRGIWDEHWVSSGRLLAFCDNLSAARYAPSDIEWNELVDAADVILHNGAMVSIVDLCHILH